MTGSKRAVTGLLRPYSPEVRALALAARAMVFEELPDPAGLLAGTGKRHRLVRLKTPAGVAAPAPRPLLESAANRGQE